MLLINESKKETKTKKFAPPIVYFYYDSMATLSSVCLPLSVICLERAFLSRILLRSLSIFNFTITTYKTTIMNILICTTCLASRNILVYIKMGILYSSYYLVANQQETKFESLQQLICLIGTRRLIWKITLPLLIEQPINIQQQLVLFI